LDLIEENNTLKGKGGLNANKGKYRVYVLSPHQKSAGTIRRENREFYTHSCEIKRETLKFQEPIQD
jgi:hypothetical protein